MAGAAENTWRIGLLGKSGSGKSSLANTLFGEKNTFKVSSSASSVTKSCMSKTKTINGRSIQLIDTPGFFDTDLDSKKFKSELLRYIVECAPGPHAILLVFPIGRFTRQEEAVVDLMVKEYFSEEALKYTTVVFTHGDQLDEGVKIEDWFKDNETLKNLVEKCGGRCCVIDNKYWKKGHEDPYRNNQNQIEQLLKTIDQTVRENRGGYYTNKLLQMVQKQIEEKKSEIKQSLTVQRTDMAGAAENTRRIVLLGKSESGKSSLANTLFGEKNTFKVSSSASSVTKSCMSKNKTINGRNIQLIDTPGLCDTDLDRKKLKSEILKCLAECAPGPLAFLLVFPLGRFTQQEEAVVDLMEKEYFGEKALKYTTVVFTHGDQLDEGVKIEDWLKDCESFKNLVEKCGGRCCVIDNKYWNKGQEDPYRNNQYQIEQLLKKVVRENRGDHYTDEMLQKVQKEIEEKKAEMKQSSPNTSGKSKKANCNLQ